MDCFVKGTEYDFENFEVKGLYAQFQVTHQAKMAIPNLQR